MHACFVSARVCSNLLRVQIPQRFSISAISKSSVFCICRRNKTQLPPSLPDAFGLTFWGAVVEDYWWVEKGAGFTHLKVCGRILFKKDGFVFGEPLDVLKEGRIL